jgi:hypothetical protein
MKRILALVLCLTATVASAETAMELTVYNNDLALVKELRSIELVGGIQEFTYTGVPERLLPETVHFRSLRDPEGTQVLEQNYRYDLLDRNSLLARYRGQQVRALVDGEWRSVRLLAAGNPTESQPLGRILDINGEIHIEGFVLPKLPEGLLLEPSLVWRLDAEKAGKHEVELSYLSEGVSWRADYVAVVGERDALDLTGWVTLDNRSGKSYADARLKLVAGDVNRVPRPAPRMAKGIETLAMASRDAGGFAEEQFFEYHLYTLGRTTTVLDNEQKQVELLRAAGVKAARKYVFRSDSWQEDGEPRAVAVTMEFANEAASGAGMPLPRGTVRVYQADAGGQLQFAGEDEIQHTPEGERVRLKLGDAFDIRGERIQTAIDQRGNRIVSRSFQITLRNHKDTAISVDVIEDVPAWQEWSVREASHNHEKRSARQLVFKVAVPAKGEAVVTYRLVTE